MKVLVVGANGQIGKQIVTLLAQSDEHDVVAMIRHPEQASDFEHMGSQVKIANLEEDVEGTADGCDAVIFAAGSGGHTGADKTLLVDLDGAYKMIDESERAKIKHFIMISSFFANDPSQGSPKMKHYTVAKQRADERLIHSKLNYTIIRPGRLVNEPGTGKISAGKDLEPVAEGRIIPREDVARTVVAALDNINTHGKVFKILMGETEIAQALEQI